MNKKRIVSVTILMLLVASFGFFGLGPLAKALYSGSAPSMLQDIFNMMYPRFLAEKNRLPYEFFHDKAAQVFWRAWCVIAISLLLPWIAGKTRFRRFWEMQTSVQWVDSLRVAFFIATIWYTRDWLSTLIELKHAILFYKPIHLYAFFHLPYPSELALYTLFCLFWASTLLVILNIKPVYTSTLSITLFLFLQGYMYCFEKVSHAYAPFGYAGVLMPFLLLEREKSRLESQDACNAWALRLIHVMIAGSYFLSGLEKLTISNGEWLLPATIASHLEQAQTTSANWLLIHHWILAVLPSLLLIFQLGFISILWLPRLRWAFIIGGVLFHLGTWWVLGVGSPITPWIFCYMFFWKMEKGNN